MQRATVSRTGRKNRFEWRRFAAWFGIVALLVQVVLPMGQVFAAESDDPASGNVRIICTAYGLKAIPVDGDTGDNPNDGTSSCPVCQVHALTLLAPAAVSVPVPAVRSAALSPLATNGHRSAWHPALPLPRGPPSTV